MPGLAGGGGLAEMGGRGFLPFPLPEPRWLLKSAFVVRAAESAPRCASSALAPGFSLS